MTAKECVIVDMDGTIAQVEHRVHHVQKEPKDFESFFNEMKNDTPRPGLVRLLNLIYQTGTPIFIFTARPIRYNIETKDWLKKYGIQYESLLMRTNPKNSDVEEKTKMLKNIRSFGYEPICWFDDRQKVVEWVRSQGIECYQVNQWEEYKKPTAGPAGLKEYPDKSLQRYLKKYPNKKEKGR